MYYQSQGQSLQLPPSVGSPRFARGTAWGAWVRFPLRAGGTLRRGLSGILVFVNFGCAIGIPLSDLQEGVNCRFLWTLVRRLV
jgi:hypothetical protein